MEEDRINSIHHQEVQRKQQKSWHDRNIITKHILVSDLVLLYDSKIKGKPRKLETTWLWTYIIKDININGTTRLNILQGRVFTKLINGSRLKQYHP